jgi:hypothetical protein
MRKADKLSTTSEPIVWTMSDPNIHNPTGLHTACYGDRFIFLYVDAAVAQSV